MKEVELRVGEKLPVDVKAHQNPSTIQEEYAAAHPRSTNISAFDFTRDGRFRFGLDTAKTIQALRDLADKIESHDVLPQRVQLIEEARCDDYLMKALIFGFVEKCPPTAEEVDLRPSRAPEQDEKAA
jgi:hypothetical protein